MFTQPSPADVVVVFTVVVGSTGASGDVWLPEGLVVESDEGLGVVCGSGLGEGATVEEEPLPHPFNVVATEASATAEAKYPAGICMMN